jgi:hypothetical protein
MGDNYEQTLNIGKSSRQKPRKFVRIFLHPPQPKPQCTPADDLEHRLCVKPTGDVVGTVRWIMTLAH